MTPDLVTKWPVGSTVRGVRFGPAVGGPAVGGSAASSSAASAPLLSLPAPALRDAMAVEGEGAATDLRVLTIPVEPPEPPDLLASIKAWLAGSEPKAAAEMTASSPTDPTGYHFVHLHGAQVHWALPRVVVVAPPDRINSVLQAALEAAYLERELQAVEVGLLEIWPEVEQDAKRAFEFRARDLKHRPLIAARFQKLVQLRARLSRILPRLLVPPAYPPTLASQVLERFRERLGVSYRVDALSAQLEMFERIYEGCSQRSSEYVHARKGLRLEWIIVILLALQTALLVWELIETRREREESKAAAAAEAAGVQAQMAEEEREAAAQSSIGAQTQPTNRFPSNRSNIPQRRPFRRP